MVAEVRPNFYRLGVRLGLGVGLELGLGLALGLKWPASRLASILSCSTILHITNEARHRAHSSFTRT